MKNKATLILTIIIMMILHTMAFYSGSNNVKCVSLLSFTAMVVAIIYIFRKEIKEMNTIILLYDIAIIIICIIILLIILLLL